MGQETRMRIVWIAEKQDNDDAFMLTGRFDGHIDTGRRIAEEFDDLSAEDAVAWGRSRCDVVLIRTGEEGYFSAGVRNPDPEEYPPWPPPGLRLERRRVRGFEALDNTEDDPPVLWDARVSVQGAEDKDPRPFHEQVRCEARAAEVKTPAAGYEEKMSASFIPETSTYQQAQQIAQEIASRAFDAVRA